MCINMLGWILKQCFMWVRVGTSALIQRAGAARSGYVPSAETIANKINASHKKAVVNNFGETYEGTRVAERATGVNATTISECCNGKYKSAGKKDGVKIIWSFA